jgi:hypothetical protein
LIGPCVLRGHEGHHAGDGAVAPQLNGAAFGVGNLAILFSSALVKSALVVTALSPPLPHPRFPLIGATRPMPGSSFTATMRRRSPSSYRRKSDGSRCAAGLDQ